MSWIGWLILACVVAAFLVVRRVGQISKKTAREYLAQGALVIDVRSNAEFQAKHLRSAIHIPLNEMESLAPRRARDKDQVLLLHCQSGSRSAAARRKLAQMGYTRPFNLGSYRRAARIVEGK
ncbi:MAG TPA: rhodanese-like domain-containing protein [Terracidiphilus sp.]|jgi:phage shock protein E|nr:rhodanese-like domain-containing protein [Terracidiphilus sp.]